MRDFKGPHGPIAARGWDRTSAGASCPGAYSLMTVIHENCEFLRAACTEFMFFTKFTGGHDMRPFRTHFNFMTGMRATGKGQLAQAFARTLRRKPVVPVLPPVVKEVDKK